MSRFGYLIFEVDAHTRYYTDQIRPLDDLDGHGRRLLEATRDVLGVIQAETTPRTDRQEQAFTVDSSRLAAQKGQLRTTLLVGPFGSRGALTDVDDGSTQMYGPRQATMTPLRALLVVPAHSQVGLLFCERVSGRHPKNILESQVFSEVGKNAGVTIRLPQLVDPEAWAAYLQGATPIEVSYIYRSTRIEDQGPSRRRVGDLKMTASGSVARRAGAAIVDGLTGRTAGRQVLVDVPALSELTPANNEFRRERAEVVVTDGDAQRTIVIERDDLPQFVYPLGSDRPSDTALFSLWDDEAERRLSDLGARLGEGSTGSDF